MPQIRVGLVSFLLTLVVLGAVPWLQPASAQVEVSLFALHNAIIGDTVAVDVEMNIPEGTVLDKPIQAYQFEVSASDSALSFIGIETDDTLSGREGWTNGSNPANGRVGGFSSRASAVSESGVLVRLLFVIGKAYKSGAVVLNEFRFNGGDPVHSPRIPEGRIPSKTED